MISTSFVSSWSRNSNSRILGCDRRYFHPQKGVSPTHLLLHSWNYAFFITLCPYSQWATCIHKRHMRYTRLIYHGENIVNFRHTWASGWRWSGWCRTYTNASVKVSLLQAPGIKKNSQLSSCLYCMFFRAKISRALHRVSSTPNNSLYHRVK
jgi:hypothetical protein